MKKNIHPDYHKITVAMANGDTFETRSCWGKEGEKMQLDVDITTHPAWQKDGVVHLKKTGQMEKFASKFGGVDFAAAKSGKKADEASA